MVYESLLCQLSKIVLVLVTCTLDKGSSLLPSDAGSHLGLGEAEDEQGHGGQCKDGDAPHAAVRTGLTSTKNLF